MPEASTVASDIAVGSLGSAFTASLNQLPNSANGSSAAVKSPDVNCAGCLMEVVSVIGSLDCVRPLSSCSPRRGQADPGQAYISDTYIRHGDALAYRRSGRRAP